MEWIIKILARSDRPGLKWLKKPYNKYPQLVEGEQQVTAKKIKSPV